jgi:hypothetical protein
MSEQPFQCIVCQEVGHRDDPIGFPYLGGLLVPYHDIATKWDAHVDCFLHALSSVSLRYDHLDNPKRLVARLMLCHTNPQDTDCMICNERIEGDVGERRVITGRDPVKLTRWYAHIVCLLDRLTNITLYLGEDRPKLPVIVNSCGYGAGVPLSPPRGSSHTPILS